MKAPILTPELRDEVKLIKLQHVLDKNYKFHKDDEKIPQHFEVFIFHSFFLFQSKFIFNVYIYLFSFIFYLRI